MKKREKSSFVFTVNRNEQLALTAVCTVTQTILSLMSGESNWETDASKKTLVLL